MWPPEGIVYFFISENLNSILSFNRVTYLENFHINYFYWVEFLLSKDRLHIYEETPIYIDVNSYDIDFFYVGNEQKNDSLEIFEQYV
jgi:hypothetical protein